MTIPSYAPPLSYYANLFSSLYKPASKLNAWFNACMQPIADINTCSALICSDYDLDTAVGVQLDVLGQILGQSRTMPFQPSGSVSPILTDDVYRLLLKAKQGINNWNGKIPSLYPLWKKLFPIGTIVFIDNQDMSATITLTGSFSSIEQDLIMNGFIVPRSECVLYHYVLLSNLPLFGFDITSAYQAGFDVGHFL